jgi:hypothetical protein
MRFKMTKNYSKVQMIGLAICATPGNLTSIEEMSDDGEYFGHEDVAKDISGRLALVENAITKAVDNTDKNSDVLKVFVIPEFFFRGVKGAYIGEADSIFKKYFVDYIRHIKDKDKYKNWLFVFGTLLTSTDIVDVKKSPTSELFEIGNDLLNVFYRLHPKNSNNAVSSKPVISLLKRIDEEETGELTGVENNLFANDISNGDKEYSSLLKSTLNYCDITAGINVYNKCFIFSGDIASNRVISIQKKHKSKEDFILNFVEKNKDNYIQSITKYPVIQEKSEKKQSDTDEYSIFEYGGITFGVDICLDHSRQRLLNHWKRNQNDYVDVQIIPSCGMDIRAGSVIAKKGGVVFNCDGEYVLEGDAENGEKCHTTLKTVKSAVTSNSSAQLSEYEKLKIKLHFDNNDYKSLYDCKTFEVHIYNVYDVKAKND